MSLNWVRNEHVGGRRLRDGNVVVVGPCNTVRCNLTRISRRWSTAYVSVSHGLLAVSLTAYTHYINLYGAHVQHALFSPGPLLPVCRVVCRVNFAHCEHPFCFFTCCLLWVPALENSDITRDRQTVRTY